MIIRKKSLAVAVGLALMSMAGIASAQITGPSSSATPYVTPTAAGWSVTSVLTVGDTVAKTGSTLGETYRMVGIPDGLGAYDNGNGTFTVLMNHELGATSGIARAHGATGAFVSEWIVDKNSLKVVSGQDLAVQHYTWDPATRNYALATGAANSFARLCSADLPATSAFYNASTGAGTQSRIFMNGEEAGNEGRAYAFVATGANKGKAYELPALGRLSFENSLANPYSGNRTVVIGTDDSTPGQIYIYTGTKTTSGTDIERAGLTNGSLAGVKVGTSAAQGGISGNLEQGQINGAFSTVPVNTNVSGAAMQANSRATGVTEFARPEDGAWADARTFYFVTTGADPDGAGPVGTQTARLYKLSFAQGSNGEVDYGNGQITMVTDASSLTGKDGTTARSFDNMTVGENGKLYIQEDPGNSSYIAKTWEFDPATKKWTQILESDRSRFLAGAPSFLTQDEESSGIIEITSILGRNDGKRYFLGDMQAHYALGGELVEGGQMYVAAVPEPETYALLLSGIGLMGTIIRRRKQSNR